MPVIKSIPGLPDDYTSQFFPGDLVSQKRNARYRAKVARAWSIEDHFDRDLVNHPLDRDLLRGEVGVIDLETGEPAIFPETTLTLLCREFGKGDVVKRSLDAVESAIVIRMKSEIKVEHCISKQQIKEWIPLEKTKDAICYPFRQRVVYDEWVGTIEEIMQDSPVQASEGGHYMLADMRGVMEPGRVLRQIINGDPIFNHAESQLPSHANPEKDFIVDVQPKILYICWNAINQLDKHPEPPKFWHGERVKDLTLLEWPCPDACPVGSTRVMKDPEDDAKYGIRTTLHIGDSRSCRAVRIIETRSRLTLLWQNGRQTEEWSTDLVPYLNIDSYESWPGEHVIWRGDQGERRPAVIQSYNGRQRVSEVLFPDTKEVQTLSVLELDSGSPLVKYGVGIGQDVMLCEDNGSAIPLMPYIGQFETPASNLNWRSDFSALADRYVRQPADFATYSPRGDPTKIDWIGRVERLNTDGSVDVRLASGNIRTVGLRNMQILNEFDPDLGQEGDDESDMDDIPDFGSDASWVTTSGEDNQIITTDGADDAMEWQDEHEYDDGMSEEGRDIEEVDPLVDFTSDQEMSPIAPKDTPLPSVPPPVPNGHVQPEAGPSRRPQANGHRTTPPARSLIDEEQWRSFEILDEAPLNHHFYGEPSASTGSRAFHSRLQKEHRALSTSLPENILVRTYGNRTDLMRVLIIGPESTPYANAPFTFDVYLNPTNFPQKPPVVHFHSHTFGKGRCNPNLYEEGTVCLSILGTWAGDQSESWNERKSSLLQVFVSISGLVLVRSPYHCEPAFAKLEGTREGKVNSRLYSEKAYVLSRTFVKQALERPMKCFVDEIAYCYLVQGRLYDVISHARALMEKANEEEEPKEENAEMWNSDAVGSLTVGAVLSLKRTIESLERIWEEYQARIWSCTA